MTAMTGNSRAPRRKRRLLVALALVLVPVACVLAGREEWRSELGPVIPHDTFPGDCSICHETGDWHTLRDTFQFDHGKETGVELRGAHKETQCLRCHNDRGPVAVFANRGCAGCHEDVHRRQLGTRCQDCHSETDWRPRSQIAKHASTRFPLIGSHAGVTCFRCHPGAQIGNFARADTDCANCHRADVARTTDPNHVQQGWVQDCENCHRPTSWQDEHFAHTSYPLIGRHRSAACSSCHINQVFQGTTRECVGCHLADYNKTSEPPHATAGFSTMCQDCHTPRGWDGAKFDHTSFPLTGAHRGLDCSKCHKNGVYRGLPKDCVSCHKSDYDRTRSPNHLASSFPTNCEMCHGTASWKGADFAHTTWPLTGAHKGRACTDCHKNNVFKGTPKNCNACHQDDYNRTKSPNHAASSFPTNCEMCHGTSSWKGADFAHTTWPLTGAHKGRACTECHKNNVFKGTPRNCDACHLDAYNRTTNPNHKAARFPTSCDTCHSTARWSGAKFNHRFPITSGKHRKLDCADCHKVPSNFQVFTCIDCHEHRKSKMDDKHRKIGGYVWASPSCLQCHPNGKE